LKQKPKTDAAPAGGAAQIKALAVGVLVAYAITCIVLIATALLLTYTKLSEASVPLIVTLACVISVFVAGFDAGRVSVEKGWLWGLAAGGLYAVLLICVLTWVAGGFSLDARKATLIILSVAGGGVGGVVGINFKK